MSDIPSIEELTVLYAGQALVGLLSHYGLESDAISLGSNSISSAAVNMGQDLARQVHLALKEQVEEIEEPAPEDPMRARIKANREGS